MAGAVIRLLPLFLLDLGSGFEPCQLRADTNAFSASRE
jgi:hypothetical protein